MIYFIPNAFIILMFYYLWSFFLYSVSIFLLPLSQALYNLKRDLGAYNYIQIKRFSWFQYCFFIYHFLAASFGLRILSILPYFSGGGGGAPNRHFSAQSPFTIYHLVVVTFLPNHRLPFWAFSARSPFRLKMS